MTMPSSARTAWRRRTTGVLAACAGLTAALVWTSAPGHADATTPPAHVDPTPGAVSVLDPAFGLTGDASVDPDDTGAFGRAMAAALASPVRYDAGPGGQPQAVVYVPPGSYRLNGLAMPSNVRLEVDAGAVLEPVRAAAAAPSAGLATARKVKALKEPVQMIQLGTHSVVPIRNVSIVGVGTSSLGGLKQRAVPTYAGWDITGSFTVDLDAADSGASNDYGFVSLINVVGFAISDVYVVQNDTIPQCTASSSTTCAVGRGFYPFPTTGRAAIVYKVGRKSGSTTAGPFYDPSQGSLTDVYSVGAPFGFGPTQISSGHDLTFADIYSQGGTPLRLETDDAAINHYFGELARVTATHIVGDRCNRAVSLSAHRQDNHDIAIADVTALGCQEGLVEASKIKSGSFTDTSVDGLHVVGGVQAQIPVNTYGIWSPGTSEQPVENRIPASSTWAAQVTDFDCTGPFTATELDPFVLDGVLQSPVCSPS